MKCPNCKSTISNDSCFCIFCGAAIGRDAETPSTKADATTPFNQFSERARKIASGPLMLWLIVLLWIQLAFGFVSSGFLFFALLFTIPALIAFSKIYSNARKYEPVQCGGLKLLNGYYGFLFIFMIVISALAVPAGILAEIYYSSLFAQTTDSLYNMKDGTTLFNSTEITKKIVVLLFLILIGLVLMCFLVWMKKKYVRSLYEAVTAGGRPQWSLPLALSLFLFPFGAFAAIADIYAMELNLVLLYVLLMKFTPGLFTYYYLLLYFVSEYKLAFAIPQALCGIGVSVLAGIIVLKLRKAD